MHSSPEELQRILAGGAPFKKYDLTNTGKLIVQDVICFTSGVGRDGPCFISFPADSPSLTPRDGCTLALNAITDMLLKKRSVAFKSTGPCSGRGERGSVLCVWSPKSYTLSLEARSKEQRTLWQDGLIAMLTSAGKQLLRKPPSALPSGART